MKISRRVLNRFLQADLSPPLGYPGGPCHVVDRIEKNIRSPKLRQDLIDEVEHNRKMTNPDAAKIYPMEHERGIGVAKKLLIGPHTQYRMDLRGITVPAIRAALSSFSKYYFSLKSNPKGGAFQSLEKDFRSGKPYLWTDPKMKLTIVMTSTGNDSVSLVTAYWEGEEDPKARPGECTLPAKPLDRR